MWSVLLLLVLVVGCGRSEELVSEGPKPVGPGPFSRQSAPATQSSGTAARSQAATEIEPAALLEIIAAAPADSTSPDALPGSAPPAPSARSKGRASIDLGAEPMVMEPGLASPAIEQALRAGLYWELVQRCRDAEGKLLPPDAIDLAFTVEADGSIAKASVTATARKREHDAAAECVRREVGASTFRGPLPENGMATRVATTVPSVD